MSILIKGMKMPKCCVECEWHEYYGGDYDWVHACRRTGTMSIENAETERANDCPLVEIPEPHGDLIDRDAFRADFSMGENCDKCGIELKRCEYDRVYTKMDFCGWLDDASAVIEAEGSDD